VLVVEDDLGIATQLVRGLTRGGYQVDHVTTAGAALAHRACDVVLLDLELPDGDGVGVCRKLRERSAAAIIVVTAYGEESDRVSALDAGADDYLVKPFGLAELQARIRAVLRRVKPGGELIRHGPLTVDLRTKKVTVQGQEVALTPKEFDILECLALDPGRVVGRQEVLEAAWDSHWYGPFTSARRARGGVAAQARRSWPDRDSTFAEASGSGGGSADAPPGRQACQGLA
jgi:DNA-binding response OmpR family regulator